MSNIIASAEVESTEDPAHNSLVVTEELSNEIAQLRHGPGPSENNSLKGSMTGSEVEYKGMVFRFPFMLESLDAPENVLLDQPKSINWVSNKIEEWMHVIDPWHGIYSGNPKLMEKYNDKEMMYRWSIYLVCLAMYGIDVTSTETISKCLMHIDEEYVMDRFVVLEHEIETINYHALRNKMTDHLSKSENVGWKINRIRQVVVQGFRMLKYQLEHNMVADTRQVRYNALVMEHEFQSTKFTDFQELFLFTAALIREKGYRKGPNGYLYQEYVTNDHLRTRFWEQKISVGDFISKFISRILYERQWVVLKKGNYQESLRRQIIECRNQEIPELTRSRFLFSYHNYLLDIRNMQVIKHKEAGLHYDSNTVACRYFDQDIDPKWLEMYDAGEAIPKETGPPIPEWEQSDAMFKKTSTVRVKEFDTTELDEFSKDDKIHVKIAEHFPKMCQSFKIPTEHIAKIFRDQHLSAPTALMYYVMVGRLLFPLGQYDNWQVAMFIKGFAKTGKSTLLQTIQKLFDPSDVAILANKGQQDFQGSSTYKKFVGLAFDITEKFSLDQSLMQSMLVGEGCNINVKNKEDVHLMRWVTGLVLSGNKVPPWKDNGGAITRRFLIFCFRNKLQNIDGSLLEKISKNMGTFLFKCALSYHWALSVFKNRLIDDPRLPFHFVDNAEKMKLETSVLVAFFESMKSKKELHFQHEMKNDMAAASEETKSKDAEITYVDLKDPCYETIPFSKVKDKILITFEKFVDLFRGYINATKCSDRVKNIPLDYNEDIHGEAFVKFGIQPRYVNEVPNFPIWREFRVLLNVGWRPNGQTEVLSPEQFLCQYAAQDSDVNWKVNGQSKEDVPESSTSKKRDRQEENESAKKKTKSSRQ